MAVVAIFGWAALVAPPASGPTLVVPGTHHLGPGVLGPATVMAAAMMAPLVLTPAHELAVSSLWHRRYQAVMVYLVGYLAGWTLMGAVMMTGLHLLRGSVGALPLVTVTGVAAVGIAATEAHRRRLRRCGATRPLALAGWRADRDCLDEGVQMAGRCVATTWALMLAVMAQGGLFAIAAGTVLMVAERRGLVPERRLARWTLLVAVFAVLLTVVELGSRSGTGLPVDPNARH